MAGALGLVLTGDTVRMDGSHAIPVYVDDSLPIVGPSRACVVTTGEVPQAGGPPLAVRLAPAGTPALGPALPVYVIPGGGSLGGSAPSSLLISLISYWNLNELSGNRADATATGNTLTDVNTVTSNPGIISTAAQFTSANSETLTHVSNASLQTGDIDFTVAAWVYLDTLIDMAIISKDNSGAGNREFDLEFFHNASATDKFRMRLFRAVDSSISVNDTTIITTATWNFVIGWHDSVADTMNIQVNNNTAVSAATGGALQASAGAEWRLSSRQNGPGAFVNGRLDEVGFWKRVLTVSERTALWNGGAGVTYPFLGA